jgi:hypothetical protein
VSDRRRLGNCDRLDCGRCARCHSRESFRAATKRAADAQARAAHAVPQWCVDARARMEACARAALEELHASLLCVRPREIAFLGADPRDLAASAEDPDCGEFGKDARLAHLRAVARMEFRIAMNGRHPFVGISAVEVEDGEEPRVSWGPHRIESLTARMIADVVGDWPRRGGR